MFDEAPIGARIADGVTGFLGSWRFLILQTILVVIWLTGNAYLLSRPFDPYPFILLNLAFLDAGCLCGAADPVGGQRSPSEIVDLEHAADETDVAESRTSGCCMATPKFRMSRGLRNDPAASRSGSWTRSRSPKPRATRYRSGAGCPEADAADPS
jgi:hypothetical protein